VKRNKAKGYFPLSQEKIFEGFQVARHGHILAPLKAIEKPRSGNI
jgi:hypothetical protein